MMWRRKLLAGAAASLGWFMRRRERAAILGGPRAARASAARETPGIVPLRWATLKRQRAAGRSDVVHASTFVACAEDGDPTHETLCSSSPPPPSRPFSPPRPPMPAGSTGRWASTCRRSPPSSRAARPTIRRLPTALRLRRSPPYYPEPVYYSAPDAYYPAPVVYAPRVYAPRPRVWVARRGRTTAGTGTAWPRPRQAPPRPARRLAALSRRRRGSGLRAQAAASRRVRENCPTRPARRLSHHRWHEPRRRCRGPATRGPRRPPGEPIMSLRSPLLSAAAVGALALVTACSSTPPRSDGVYEAPMASAPMYGETGSGDEHRGGSGRRRGRRAPVRSSAR